jgi:hypothetical protein
MRQFEGEQVLTLKEASEKFDVPVSWLRRQIGKPMLANGELVRVVKFPADKNFYMFLSELEEIAKPRVYSIDYIKLTQEAYEKDPEKESEEDEQ